MMTWMIGKFSYTPDALPDARTISTPTDKILSEGARQVQEWARIRKAIPSTDTAFRLCSRNNAEDIVLRADEWNILVRVNGTRTVGEISQEPGMSEIETAKVLYRLLEAELIEVAEKPVRSPKRIVGKAFFDLVQRELTSVMGPMAVVIVEDHVSEMNEKASAFPGERAAELIERISLEISDEGKRVSFQKRMLEILKKI